MHFLGASTALAALLLGFAQAGDMNPTTVVNGAGNLLVDFQDTMVNIGNVKPSDVLGMLFSQCDELGCNSNPFEMDTKFAGTGDTQGSIYVTVQQDHYATWIKNGLIEALQAAADAAAQPTQGVWRESVSHWALDTTAHPITTYSLPASIAVYHGDGGLNTDATDWINIGISVTQEDGGLGSFCALVSGVGGALASALDGGVAGEYVTSLFSIFKVVLNDIMGIS
ncbi:hypothetical protein BX600DRAFT_435402 [Xylariales sp. PMI_506]|nr:hypothetical protein BX600DRAFT_435402 [Xylariales sp. PMI_506]